MKVSLLGLTLETLEHRSPCLPLYNLKSYAHQDPELATSTNITIHEELLRTPDEELFDTIARSDPDLLALSCYLWSTEKMLEIARKLSLRNPKLKVILGGPDAGPRAERLLKRHSFLTGVINGEGEESFRLLLRRLSGLDGGNWTSTPGLIYKVTDDVQSNPRPDPIDLDRVPLTLHYEDFVERHGRWLYMESSRGCKYRCIYCSFYSQGYKWRTRSLESVLGAIDEAEKGGSKYISFLDAGFNQDKERFRTVLNYLRERPNLTFDGLEINIEDMEEVDIKLLSETTSGRLGVGLQTTNPTSMLAIGRRHNPEKFKSGVENLRKYDIRFNIDLICGLPGDDYDHFKKSIDDAYRYRPNSILIFPLMVLPGTRLEDQADKWDVKYLKDPPYTLLSTKTFSVEDLARGNRLLTVNHMMRTFSFDSAAFQLIARELDRRPSDMLESFISGEWRNARVTDDELDRWKDAVYVDETIIAINAFFAHEFMSAGYPEIPVAIRDLLAFQFETGRINSNSAASTFKTKDETDQECRGPKCSPFTKIIRVQTDVIKLVSEHCPLSEAQRASHNLLLQRTKKSVKRMLISDAIAQILSLANGELTKEEIIERIMLTGHTKEEISQTIDELLERELLQI